MHRQNKRNQVISCHSTILKIKELWMLLNTKNILNESTLLYGFLFRKIIDINYFIPPNID